VLLRWYLTAETECLATDAVGDEEEEGAEDEDGEGAELDEVTDPSSFCLIALPCLWLSSLPRQTWKMTQQISVYL